MLSRMPQWGLNNHKINLYPQISSNCLSMSPRTLVYVFYLDYLSIYVKKSFKKVECHFNIYFLVLFRTGD